MDLEKLKFISELIKFLEYNQDETLNNLKDDSLKSKELFHYGRYHQIILTIDFIKEKLTHQ